MKFTTTLGVGCAAAVILLLFLFGIGVDNAQSTNDHHHHQRRLLALNFLSDPKSVQLRNPLLGATNNDIWSANIQSNSILPNPNSETVLFWMIPKSGTTTVKHLWRCMNLTLANELGSKYTNEKELRTIEGKHSKYIFLNVDTTSEEGMLHAAQLGLVPSGKADLISASLIKLAVQHLYDPMHKGRVISLFRHPIKRWISRFYYLQMATWERTYQPEWQTITIMDYAKKYSPGNQLIRKLTGKYHGGLEMAKRIVSNHFIVGLTDEMEESIHRFNIVMGINEQDEVNKRCMDEFFGGGDDLHDTATNASAAKAIQIHILI